MGYFPLACGRIRRLLTSALSYRDRFAERPFEYGLLGPLRREALRIGRIPKPESISRQYDGRSGLR